MNRRLASSALVLALTFSAASVSHAAGFAGASAGTTTNAPVKGKRISFDLRNGSSAPLTIQMGDQQMTIAPGKTSSLKLVEGTQIVAVNATGHVAAGTVLATADRALSGNTVVVN